MYFFGDGFDLYSATTDAYMGGTYWDSGNGAGFTFVPGRFSGSRGININISALILTKSSALNENVHHFNVAWQTTVGSLTGTTPRFSIQIIDGTTTQCSIVFRSDGAILLTSGGPTGTALATYTGAITAVSTWYGFEFEVVIHNTAGSFTARKNGNPSNDFTLGSLNTRTTANNYANKITIGNSGTASGVENIDDFLWRSDPTSLPWVGDIRCYTRMPASDASVQWTPSGSVVPMVNFPGGATNSAGLGGTVHYQPFVAVCDGTIGSVSMSCLGAVTATIKCSIYASAAGVPTAVLGSANIVTNPGVGTTTWTFPTPVPVLQGVTYYAAVVASASSGGFGTASGPPGGYLPLTNSTSYASFPVANPPSLGAGTNHGVTINITPTPANAGFVADAMQDAAASYVASSTVGQTDLYSIASIATTPASVIGVTTRAVAQKTDAGTRNIDVEVKSGGTTSSGTSTALNTSWGWLWRVDCTDPATGAAWTPVAVNNAQIGVKVTA